MQLIYELNKDDPDSNFIKSGVTMKFPIYYITWPILIKSLLAWMEQYIITIGPKTQEFYRAL